MADPDPIGSYSGRHNQLSDYQLKLLLPCCPCCLFRDVHLETTIEPRLFLLQVCVSMIGSGIFS